MEKFGIGQSNTRVEDARLLTGKGNYLDDATLPQQAHAVFVRSPFPHAEILDIDVGDAAVADDVIAVVTGQDLESAGIGHIPCLAPVQNSDGSKCAMPARPALATERVRFVGEAVVMVVAESVNAAKDAAELVFVEYTEPAAATLLLK